MATICPTILATDPHDFRAQIDRVAPFAKRIQIDLADGQFAPVKTISLEQVWWPEGISVDIHLMYQKPAEVMDEIVHLQPNMVIVHAEADGNFIEFANVMHAAGIKVGVALLPSTHPKVLVPALKHIDHVLIFSGHLGYFGGTADLTLVGKVEALKALKPGLEIGWDGGINDKNISKLAVAGVDVLNVGGFIQKAGDPQAAYATLKAVV